MERPLGLDGDAANRRVPPLEKARHADERPRGAESRDEVRESAARLGPDLRARRLEVRPPVGGIGVLVRVEVLRPRAPSGATRLPDRAVGALERVGQDELRAVRREGSPGARRRRDGRKDRVTGNPSARPSIASAMPVLPEVASRIVFPAVSAPRRCRREASRRAGRSLTLPHGFRCSALASRRSPGTSAQMRASSRRGVPPTASSRRRPATRLAFPDASSCRLAARNASKTKKPAGRSGGLTGPVGKTLASRWTGGCRAPRGVRTTAVGHSTPIHRIQYTSADARGFGGASL